MKKQRIISKVLLAGALLPVTSLAFVNTSCSDSEKLFFNIQAGDLDITFCDKGASIFSIKYKDEYITYHPHDKNVFLQDDNYYGKTLGRVAGRIKDGKLNVGGKDYQLEVNEVKHDGQTEKNNTLHGGTHSLATKNFNRTIGETENYYTVSFNYASPAGESGFPETVNSTFTYNIYKNISKIDLYITASSSGPTPINLSTHPFFRLGGPGTTIREHLLQIPADNMAVYDNMIGEMKGGQIVVGTQSVTSTPWDFKTAKQIGSAIDGARTQDPVSGGIDHIWKLNSGATNTIQLINPTNGRKLTVETDASGVIMYANCFPKLGQRMNDGELDTQDAAITIEPYTYFTKDTIDSLIVQPTEPFTRYISYTISDSN